MFPSCHHSKKINFRKLPVNTPVWDPYYGDGKLVPTGEVAKFRGKNLAIEPNGRFAGQCHPRLAIRQGNLLLTNRYRCHETRLFKLTIGSIWSRADKPDHFYLMVAADKSYDLSTGELIDHYAKFLPVTIHEAKLMVGMNDD